VLFYRKLASSVGLVGLNLKPFRSKILISLVGRDIQPATSVESRLENISHFLFEIVVRNCNRLFWMKNDVSAAQKIWNCGKEMDFLFNGEEDVVLCSLKVLEA